MIEIPLRACSFNKQYRKLTLASEYCGMPSILKIRSDYTDKVIMFAPVQPGDPLFDQDQWDGEQMIYRPMSDDKINVDYLVIFNQY